MFWLMYVMKNLEIYIIFHGVIKLFTLFYNITIII